MEMYMHIVIDKNGNLQQEIRPYPQSIEQEQKIKERAQTLKEDRNRDADISDQHQKYCDEMRDMRDPAYQM